MARKKRPGGRNETKQDQVLSVEAPEAPEPERELEPVAVAADAKTLPDEEQADHLSAMKAAQEAAETEMNRAREESYARAVAVMQEADDTYEPGSIDIDAYLEEDDAGSDAFDASADSESPAPVTAASANSSLAGGLAGVAILLLVIIGVGASLLDDSKEDIPESQLSFIEEWQAIQDDYEEASTSAREDEVGKEADFHLNENRSSVDEWVGRVDEVTSSGRIVVKHKGIKYTLHPDDDLSGSQLDAVRGINDGDRIRFSGRLNGESSWTTSGRIDDPEMKVKSSSVVSHDRSIVFY